MIPATSEQLAAWRAGNTIAPQFEIQFALNGNSFPTVNARPSPATPCGSMGKATYCLDILDPGAVCGPFLERVPQGSPVVCLTVGVDGSDFSFVDGDTYVLSVTTAGSVRVQDQVTATYTRKAPDPAYCSNSGQVTCTYFHHVSPVQP